jgi:alpha-glucosidase
MSLFKRPGRLQQYFASENCVTVDFDLAKAKVCSPLPGILNVYIQHIGEPFSPFEPALAQQAIDNLTIDVKAVNDKLQITSAEYKLELGRDMAFTIYNAQNEPMCSTEDQLHVQLKGTKMGIYFKLSANDAFVGLGEKTGPVNKRGRAYTHWNTDCFGYHDGSDPLYMTIPFFTVLNGNGCYGVFLNNPGKTHVNLGASNDRFYSITSEAGGLDLYFIQGSTPIEIIQKYTQLTGSMPLPPLWSLGLQQCRYSYYPDKEVMRVAQTYREKQLGLDVLYLDIHYMHAFKVFTWHPTDFPSPEALTKQLHDLGIHTVVIIDPGIKTEDNYPPFESGREADIFLKYPDKTNYTANVWPGRCVFPDFTYPKARLWWQDQFDTLIKKDGISGFWTDMNEPATWGQNTPEIIEHRLSDEQTLSHDAIRNAYGMMMAQATNEAQLKHKPEARPFVLTRSGYSGVQRYAACWTGDNTANDEHMLLGVRLVCNLNAAGIAFCGSDIGGFIGNASADLFCRWLSIGAFTPLMRIHSMINSHANDPWSYGETTEIIARNYINLRYRLLPYLYAAFRLHYTQHIPVCTALLLHEPANADLLVNRYQHQYFFGKALMVAALESYKEYVEVYFPLQFNTYYHLFTCEQFAAGQKAIVHAPLAVLPVFVGAGSVIISQSAVLHTGQRPEIVELHVYAGEQNFEQLWYEDDHSTNSYKNGAFAERMITHIAAQRTVNISANTNGFNSGIKSLRLILHHVKGIQNISINGLETPVQTTTYSWLNPLPNYDPLGEAELRFDEQVLCAELMISDDAVSIQY